MLILFLDTETTGLPEGKNISLYQTQKWPYVIQLSYIIFDTEVNEVVHTFDSVIKLDDSVEISEKSISMHGVTRERSQTEGVNMKGALEELNDNLKTIDLIVGHNISFDKQIMIVENIRNNVFSLFPKKRSFCTMKEYKMYCDIKKERADGTTYAKYPTLCELYEKLFGTKPDNLHNSYVDVLVCARCYMQKEYEKDILNTSNTFRMEWGGM